MSRLKEDARSLVYVVVVALGVGIGLAVFFWRRDGDWDWRPFVIPLMSVPFWFAWYWIHSVGRQ